MPMDANEIEQLIKDATKNTGMKTMKQIFLKMNNGSRNNI